MATRKTDYTEASIRVLKGLEPVRQRPGMYTRTDNPLHIIQEVIDNAADEALGGFARSIAVTLFEDGGVAVENGTVTVEASPGTMSGDTTVPPATATRTRMPPSATSTARIWNNEAVSPFEPSASGMRYRSNGMRTPLDVEPTGGT